MLFEQKDFINVEEKSTKELDFIKLQYEKGKITKGMALSAAQSELFNLEQKIKVLSLYSTKEEIEKIKIVVDNFKNFIDSITICENNLS